MAGSCERRNGSGISIIEEKYLDQLNRLQLCGIRVHCGWLTANGHLRHWVSGYGSVLISRVTELLWAPCMSKCWTSISWEKMGAKKLDFCLFFSDGCLSLFFDTFFARLQNSKKRLLALSSLSVRPSFRVSASPSVCAEQLGSRSADFHEIWDLRFLSKTCWENSSLITTWQDHWVLYMTTLCVCAKILLNSSQNEKCFKVVEKIKSPFSCSAIISENRTICEIMWKNMIEAERPQLTI